MMEAVTSHLIELRKRVIYALVSLLTIFAALFPFAKYLYHALALPLLAHLPGGQHLIAIGVSSTFFTPIKLSLVLAFFLAVPFMFYQLWMFIAPGLYKRERLLIWPLLLISIGLFYLGVAFAYFVVFPLVFSFLVSMTPQGVHLLPDIAEYLDFTLSLFFAFGLAFEIPVFILLITLSGVVSIQTLKKQRPYVIVIAFILGMFLTPPDVLSQVLLAIPMCLLFELGLYLAARIQPKKREVVEEPI